MTCTDGKDTWITTFQSVAYSPILSINDVATLSDRIIQPGETGTLKITFSNVGEANANNILVETFSSSTDIKFKKMTFVIDELTAGETSTVTADFTVAADALVGSVYEILCSVNADYATSKETYPLKVGLLGDDFETGDFSENEWKIEGKGVWVIDSTNANSGQYCIKSDMVGSNEYAKLKLQIEVMADGPLTFFVKTSCEPNYDVLEFYVNSLIVQKWSGEKPWTQYTYDMKKGVYALEWRYRKDTSGSEGEDRAYIDDIFFPPVSVVTMLDAVEDLRYEIQEENLTLTWEAVEAAEEYIVRRDGEIVATQSATSFNESVVDDIITYSVVAKNGDNYSAPTFVVVNPEYKSGDKVVNIENKEVSVYPNPTNGMIYIKLDKTFDAVVYNYQGQVVMREYDNNGQIDMSGLKTGIYFIEIRDGNDVRIEKVILNK